MTQAQLQLRCPVCGEVGALRCSRCKGVFYCNAEHQRAHYGTHRRICAKDSPRVAKSVEAMLDVAAPLFVFGRAFDSVAVATESVSLEQIDGRDVLIAVTGANAGKAVTPREFCAERPELFFVAHSCAKGLAFALAFALAAADVAASAGRGDGRSVALSYGGELVETVGVVERAPVTQKTFTAVCFVDAASGNTYGSTASAAAEHGMAFVRTCTGRVVLVDFAAAQFGAFDLHNQAPLLVCDRDSERAREVYGSTDGWTYVEGTAALGEALQRYLQANDPDVAAADFGASSSLAGQIRKAVQHIVAILRTAFDLAVPSTSSTS